jgi:cytidine deaminase
MNEPVDDAALLAQAIEARRKAYAPYSRFAVGAAVLTASGKVFHGCNIENAAYGVACCAERTGLFSAWAAGEREIVAIAVVADTERPASPCGSCRQVIFELAPEARVVLGNLRGEIEPTTPQALLPGGFGPGDLT